MNEGTRSPSIRALLTREYWEPLTLRIGSGSESDLFEGHHLSWLNIDAPHAINVTIGTALWNDLGMRG